MKSRFSPRSRSPVSVPRSAPRAPPPAPPLPKQTTTSRPKVSPTSDSFQTQLVNGRNNLKRTDHGMVHPDLPGIRTRRDQNQPAHEFADLTQDARASTHRLMSKDTGRETLTHLNDSTQRLNPGRVGTPENPLTAVDIHTGRNKTTMNMGHHPRVDDLASVPNAYRHDGKAGSGRPSQITYDETAPSAIRFNSLGHESVHAWRASNGVQVSPLEISKHDNNPVFDLYPPGKERFKDRVSKHTLLKEEFETVGLSPTPKFPNAPTENKIRNEHNLPNRDNYSSHSPNNSFILDDVKEYDKLTDTRNFFDKVTGQPSPVGEILNHIEK